MTDVNYILVLFTVLVIPAADTKLGYPDYESVWTLVTAQSSDRSTVYFNHSLGQLPGLVEVLVTPLDGPYKGYIFKATGNGDRDDDERRDYGGVVYLYNYVSVVVTLPKRNNGHAGGYAIRTGDDSYWTGGSSYSSMEAYVKVRCWSPSIMPDPCFQANDVDVESGASSTFANYLEYSHGAGGVPEMVNVRTRLTNDVNSWYSDSQGTNRYIARQSHPHYGGLVSGFDDQYVRVWLPSISGRGNIVVLQQKPRNLFVAASDGWGIGLSKSGHTTLDIRVWCTIGNTVYTQNTTQIGSVVTDEQTTLSIGTPDNVPSIMDVFTSVMFKAQGGENDGFHFNGIDGAMSQVATSAPCTYGGIIYIFNSNNVTLRRPTQSQGAAVCISDTNSDGQNTGPIVNGEVSITMWNLISPSGKLNQNTFKLHMRETSIDYPNIGSIRTIHKRQCLYECLKRNLCVAVTFESDSSICAMFDYFSSAITTPNYASDVWSLIFE